MPDKQEGHRKFKFSVNGVDFETEEATLTGAQIKARVADLPAGSGLSLEGKGQDPDHLIADDEVVDLSSYNGHPHFNTVPPATFG